MKFLHCMLRVHDVDETLAFYVDKLGLVLVRRNDYPQGQFSLLFVATHEGAPEIELTYNWDGRSYEGGTNFGHIAFAVEDIYEVCARLEARGVTVLRPPRDGKMAFVKDPNGISIELLQQGAPKPPCEPWTSRPNVGTW